MNRSPRRRKRREQRGVALVLVLMVTGVLAILMLQFALTAREHTVRAQQLVDRARADLLLHSAKAETLFTLVTEPWSDYAAAGEASALPVGWNFAGRPFELGGAKVSLQDLNGLVPMVQPGDPLGDYATMLRVVGLPPDRVRSAVDALAAALGPPEDAPLQDLDELGQISGLTIAEIAQLRDIATLYPTRLFNPMTATAGALSVRYSDTTLQGLLTLREQGSLDGESFFSVTGQGTDDLLAFIVGPGFRITTRVSLGDFAAAEEFTVRVQPYAIDPFELWSQRRPTEAAASK